MNFKWRSGRNRATVKAELHFFVKFDDKCIEFDDFLVKQETLLAAAASN